MIQFGEQSSKKLREDCLARQKGSRADKVEDRRRVASTLIEGWKKNASCAQIPELKEQEFEELSQLMWL